MSDEQTPDMDAATSALEQKLDLLLDAVAGLQTTVSDQEAELARLRGQHVPTPRSIKRPRQRPGQSHGRIRHFDVSTDATMNPKLTAEMWRPDALGSCPCGEVVYAKTVTIKGEQDIIDSQRPVMSTQSGELQRQAHRFVEDPESGELLVPEGLRLNDEKRAHLRECVAASQAANPLLQQRLADRVQEAREDAEKAHQENAA